jgi:EAL domain-containing protein (putative c-di-GMP-specific phosphodiesterase class I)
MATTSTWDLPRVHPGATAESSRRVICSSLQAVRRHLGMEVAFVGRFDHGRRIFEFVDTGDSFCPIDQGESDPREGSYCDLVASGRIPELIPDTAQVPEVADLPATRDLPVGSHISVPLRSAGGETFGTFCCFSRQADPSLRRRDLDILKVVGEVVGEHLHFLLGRREAHDEALSRVGDVLDAGGPTMALQPIVDLRSDRVAGFEALARFPREIGWTPDRWFAEARAVGLGPELEGSAVSAALRLLPRIPEGTSLAVNVSAHTLSSSDDVARLMARDEPARLVLEITEHERLVLDEPTRERLAWLRSTGVRVAVDDAGSGYAGLEHILQLAPDVLKLDRVLVDGIADDPARQAMCDAMVRFTARTGATLVAEGIETEADLETLRYLGVRHAQGYLLGRPEVWPEEETR